MTLRPLDTLDDLAAARAQAAVRPALIFKHSLTCGTSAMAMEEMQDLVAGATFDADVYVVRVQKARDVSRAIEAELGVRHESPQVLLLVDGRVVWQASHFRVTAAAVLAAMQPYTTVTAGRVV